MESKDAVTIVISTWDGYACAWPPLCHGFEKYWPDCPWPIKFITNFLDPPCGEGLKLGEDTCDWSGTMRTVLDIVETPILLFMSEDAWLSGRVDSDAILDFAKFVLDEEVNYIRLSRARPSRVRHSFESDERLVVLVDGTQQCTSLQPALWRTSVFQSLLAEDETPWQFEGMAPHRSRGIPGFLTLGRNCQVFPYVSHVVPGWKASPLRRGIWTESAKIYAQREGLKIDFSQQPETHMRLT